MIDCIFQKQTELTAIRVMGKNLLFAKQQGGYYKYTPIDGLKLEIGGILREFPDLKDKDKGEMRKITIERFKEKIRSFNTEIEIKDYLKEDLRKHGFTFVGYQKKGHRFQRE